MSKISIVVPTRNEQENINKLLIVLMAFKNNGYDSEVVVVDDSDDATATIAQNMGVRVLKGKRKGLGQAIVDGIEASESDIVVVMDADGSHSPREIPTLLKPILEQGCDLVIGSRYVSGGDYSNWALIRQIQSVIGVKLMQLVTGVTDSNSGFFAFRKTILNGITLKADSWKIMLEVLFKGKWISKTEVPIVFKDREEGVSKNNNKERLYHAIHMLKLLVWKYNRYIKFACVGGIGAIWYFSILYILTEYANVWYGFSAIVATLIAITNNYLINHHYTFRKVRQNNRNMFKGWLKYAGNSAVGDGVDWCMMILFTEVFGIWYMLSAFIASGVASIIKYTMARKLVWGNKGRNAKDADYEWHSFYKGLPWQKRWKRIIASIVKEFAEYPSGNAGKLLDYGCGSSPQGLLINHNDYLGVDASEEKIEYMKNKWLDKCAFATTDIMGTLSRAGKNFDTILFIEVIEHLKDEAEALDILKKFHRILNDRGKLIVATPNFGGFMGKWMDRLYGVFQKNAYQHEHTLKFNLPMLVNLCDEAGFELVKYMIPSGADMVCHFEKGINI